MTWHKINENQIVCLETGVIIEVVKDEFCKKVVLNSSNGRIVLSFHPCGWGWILKKVGVEE